MYRALVIGCGNIGALYDIDNDDILTHVKAYHLHSSFSEVAVYDNNRTLAETVAAKYGCTILDEVSVQNIAGFDCVSICTPTASHVDYLKMVINSGARVVICEKPVSYDAGELARAEELYKTNTAKVLVNYMRRFQPCYKMLKNRIDEIKKSERITSISIRYQKGFVHNCSHAIDTLEYLTGSDFELTNFKAQAPVYDHFDNDPTLSLQAMWGEVQVDILGLGNVKFSHFEIEIYFEYHKISLKDSGKIIETYKAEKNERILLPLSLQQEQSMTGCLHHFMKHVVEHAQQLLAGTTEEDNFLNALHLNRRLLNYLNTHG